MKPFVLLLSLAAPLMAETSLTIYNGGFALVRDDVALDLKPGLNAVAYNQATAQLQPDSVTLRDPVGGVPLRIVEQGYRNDPVSEQRLLALNEGREIDFLIRETMKPDRLVRGRIVRSGYIPGGASVQPLVEVDGQLRFSLPGTPLFPSLPDDSVLKPALNWTILSKEAAKLDGRVSYLSQGLGWQADYNVVVNEKDSTLDLVGLVTFRNDCGRDFTNAKVKLMAGEVSRVQPVPQANYGRAKAALMAADEFGGVTEKAFDEFHLYTIGMPVTLRDRESKQVEFVTAGKIPARKAFVYEYLRPGMWHLYDPAYATSNRDLGMQGDGKVRVFWEFRNDKASNLGIPLPKGVVRFYSQDDDRNLEFVGENEIDHTPQGEEVRINTGNAFDIVVERKRVDYVLDTSNKTLRESFEIKLRNRKAAPVEVRVIEHPFRTATWKLTQSTAAFTKKDSNTLEATVPVAPDKEQTVRYEVLYTW